MRRRRRASVQSQPKTRAGAASPPRPVFNRVRSVAPGRVAPRALRPTRANPFPKVTGLFCRLPLPALFILSRGCSPWGPDAVIGTPRREILLQMDFQGLSVTYWIPGTPRYSSLSRRLFLPIIGFHSARSQVKQKRQLCPVSPPTSPPQFASPPPHPCARILTRFPFADRKNDCHPA